MGNIFFGLGVVLLISLLVFGAIIILSSKSEPSHKTHPHKSKRRKHLAHSVS